MTENLTLLCHRDELNNQSFVIFNLPKYSVGAILNNDEVYCYLNICPHAGAPVCEGRVTALRSASGPFNTLDDRNSRVLICPWHGYEFDISTGKGILDGCGNLVKLPVSIKDDKVWIRF